MTTRLSREQIDWLVHELGLKKAQPFLDLGILPIMGGAEDDEDKDDDTEEKDDSEKDDEETEAKKDQGKDDSEDDDDLPDDEETRKFLENTLKIPEIQAAIKAASREAYKEGVGQSLTQLREEMKESMEDRLAEIAHDLRDGSITEKQAERQAKRLAKDLGKDQSDGSETQDDEDDEDKTADDGKKKDGDELQQRERRVRLRELRNYARDALADMETSEYVPELINDRITADMGEDDIDDLIEKSRDVRQRIRRDVMKELRKTGWKSPKDLRAGGDDEERDTTASGRSNGSDASGPPSRDNKGQSLTKGRRQNLRSRFSYADRGRGS